MMDTNEDRLSMNPTSVSIGDIHSEQLLPFNENMMNEELFQFLGNQQYMMSDGSQINETTRNVVNSSVNAMQSSHLADVNINSHSIDTCNYVSNYAQHFHDSQDPQHRYNVKFRSNSSLSSPSISTVSETVTHVSETDNSLQVQNNFIPVSSAVQPLNVNENYNMTSVNNWSHSEMSDNSHNHNHLRSVKDVATINVNVGPKMMPQTCQVMRPRISSFIQNAPPMAPSTTSTPVSQTVNQIATTNHSKVHQQNHIKDVQQSNKLLDFTLVEKRTVITFRVVDQIVDQTGKIIKETIIKDEEIIKSLGKTQWSDSITPSSTISSVSRFPSHTTNSGDLADVSSSGKSTPSGLNQTNEQLLRTHSNSNELFNKIPTPVTKHTTTSKDMSDFNVKIDSRTPIVNIKKNNDLSAINTFVDKNLDEGISEIEEEERRETATALLSLQTQRSLNIDIGSSDQLYINRSSLRQGTKIMGKWRDKNFYPAIISKYLSQNNKWMVTFEDKATRSLFENELIRIEFLIEGQDVMVAISEGFCAKGTIKRVISNDNDIVYEVEHIKDDKKVMKQYHLKDLFLNAEQGASLTLKSAKHSINGAVFADVDLDNIVCGKRARTTKQDNITVKNIASFKNGKRKLTETDECFDINDYNEEEEDIPFKSKKKAIYVRTTKKKTESLHTLFNSEHSLSISPRTTKSSISMPPQELIKLLGPLPENLGMFEGVSFLLTCGDRGNINDEKCSEESNAERSTPFDKSYLIKQIENGGGKVFESFDDAKNSENNCDTVLIADTYYRSIKYIQCLAAGIPIVSHLWVIDCCRQNKFLKRDNYILPAGFSIITNALPSDKNTFRKSSTLFKGMKFYFGSKSPEKLTDLWSPVLAAAQAVIVDQNASLFSNISRKTVDIIIGDPSCPNDLVKKAKQMKIPVVSSEYIVQCLINGRKLPYDQNVMFSYTYNKNNAL